MKWRWSCLFISYRLPLYSHPPLLTVTWSPVSVCIIKCFALTHFYISYALFFHLSVPAIIHKWTPLFPLFYNVRSFVFSCWSHDVIVCIAPSTYSLPAGGTSIQTPGTATFIDCQWLVAHDKQVWQQRNSPFFLASDPYRTLHPFRNEPPGLNSAFWFCLMVHS